MVTLPTRVFDSFMFCPIVLGKTSFCSYLIVALPTRVFYSFMNCPFVFSKMSLCTSLIVALHAGIFDSLHKLSFCVRPDLTVKLIVYRTGHKRI